MTETIKRTTAPYRYDIVGSFLRPETLKEAREQYKQGDITAEALREVEDKEIIELIKQQEVAGLKSVTDGEFRRSWWHLDFFWGLQGVSKVDELGYEFADEVTRAETARVTGRISGENHPFVEDFKFTLAHTSEGVEARQTIPAPAQLLAEILRPENVAATNEFYTSQDELVADVATAYGVVLTDLYEAGARTVQLDDCTWGALVRPEGKEYTALEQQELDKQKALFLKVNNTAIAQAPDGLTITTHVCRGNYHSTWSSAGAYDSVATPLFDQENVSAYYLEYDTDRSGGFEPLAHVSNGKKVVLGLITSKSGELEDRGDVIARIHEASKYVPLENLYLSTQCGFSSTEEGNILTEEDQWAKIALVKSVAEEVWG